jgi:hypothetical protein
MHPLVKKLIAIAATQIGVHEEGGNNKGPQIVKYQEATWINPEPGPWCAAFCCWVMREWVKDPEVQKHFGITAWRSRWPSAYGWKQWADKENMMALDNTALAKAGDFVIFNFSHIGIVTEDQPNRATKIKTIEGNTSKGGQRDSVNGDYVLAMERSPSLVLWYIRIIQ